MFSKITCRVVAVVAVAVGIGAAARGSVMVSAGPLDQEHVADFGGSLRLAYGFNDTFPYAQTFTVGRSGLLDRVEVQLWRAASPTLPDDPVVVQIRATLPDGAPLPSATAALATVNIPASEVTTDEFTGAFSGVDLGIQAVPVVAGQRLAIVLSASGDDFWYMWGSTDWSRQGAAVDYTAGSNWTLLDGRTTYTQYPEIDHGFRTFVTVPEPAAMVGMVAGLVLLRRVRGGEGRLPNAKRKASGYY